ncbi:MAG TPA: hypothetical protein VF944_10855 [Candidatus Bathyarchaeia archaeon]
MKMDDFVKAAKSYAGDDHSGWWAEEVRRGSADVLVIYKKEEPKGTIEVDSYEEKAAWVAALQVVNSTLKR